MRQMSTKIKRSRRGQQKDWPDSIVLVALSLLMAAAVLAWHYLAYSKSSSTFSSSLQKRRQIKSAKCKCKARQTEMANNLANFLSYF